ncbi:MAG TPA: hypothetical protein PKG63_05650 [Bacteroidales bacterium]|jgi:hypothetical protein|nr:hypothetical protein [Bacteroidales bacterium]HNV95938.1 hypothetical protein [Bacteroidales bacterium]
MRNVRLSISLILIVLSSSFSVFSQEDSGKCDVNLNIGSDIMSRYVWRGTDYGNSPSIQPTLSVTVKNFEIGYWGAIATNSFYKEIDLYAKYTVKNFSLILTDYYIPYANGIDASPDNRYFIFDDKKTAHTIETALQFKGNENFPLWLLAGAFVYGNDKRWGYDAAKDTTDKTYYSTYVELGYSFKVKDNNADVFLGFTPQAGAYGNTMGVINMGVTGYRKIKISNDFELPVKGSLIFNPQSQNVYLLFGFTF